MKFICFSRPHSIDNTSYRHATLNGQLSRAVTTVIPQNPYNQMDIISTTINGSLDPRSPILIKELPRNVASPSKANKTNENKEEKTDNNQIKN